MLIDDYIDYFEHQADNHPDLGAASFRLISVDEAMGDFRGGVPTKGLILRLIEYSYSVGDGGRTNMEKTIQGGFLVAQHYSNRATGTEGYKSAMTIAERVTDELIEKIIADSIAGHPLFNYSLDSRQNFQVNPLPRSGDGSYAGYMVLFEFSNFFRVCPTHDDAPAWADGGATPY